MKYVYIITCLLIVSCGSAPKLYLETSVVCRYDNPIFTINKEDMVFNSEIYEDESTEVRYWSSDKYLTKLKTDKRINIGRLIRYDRKDGKIIRVRYQYINGSDDIFKRTYYNKDGSIQKIIDYDKGYKICWAEAIAIVRKIAKQEIKKYGVTQFYAVHNNLNKFPNEKATWFVGFMDGNDKLRKYEYKKGAIRYKIDGVTGKFLGTRHIITEHN